MLPTRLKRLPSLLRALTVRFNPLIRPLALLARGRLALSALLGSLAQRWRALTFAGNSLARSMQPCESPIPESVRSQISEFLQNRFRTSPGSACDYVPHRDAMSRP